MRKVTRTLLATTAVAGLLAVPVAGATAADTATTVVSFSVTPGALSIAQTPETEVALGSSAFSLTGTAFEDDMNDITVTDSQNLAGTWCVTIGLSDENGIDGAGFENADGTEEVDGSAAKVWVSNLGTPTLNMTATTTAVAEPSGVAMDLGGTLVSGVTALGGGSVTYTPHIKVTIPDGTANDAYSGTITHTAATGC